MKDQIKHSDGSIQHIEEIPQEVKQIFRTVWEIPQRSLIDMAADRGVFIDQGQSLNLFMESPNIGKLSSMYLYAWKKGLKTTYYLRSRGATQINKTTVPNAQAAVSCSLENPEACESCT
jgi:ribonucleoside-diphosphate reductase alpha chain